MFHTASIFIYFNRICIGNLNNDGGKNRISRSTPERHFNTNLSVMDKRTKAKKEHFPCVKRQKTSVT